MTGMPHLDYIDLSYNGIESLESGTIILESSYNNVYLYNNHLTSIAEGALVGNPLSCGCEITWLVTNSTYMGQLDDDTACFNGELVSDLDPDLFEMLCTK
ncbi:hypothetical protein Pcinc_005332 [Petrolisthes cinctipes]|uniref:Uncharacterized protein n=1 Tax=Petrolisthes cinctipes TaxID=88211 RepID=A0AAE1GCT8_PETCI|nr:hypothetical protein Pcinc_005332 [Petrolisthes cinctipes]